MAIYDFLFFLLSLGLIALGAVWFSKAATRLARLLSFPRFLVGATIVSLATTAPEASVSLISGITKHPDLALGNILGSPIVNLGLILGLVLFFGSRSAMVLSREAIKDNLFLIAAVILVFVLSLSGLLNLWGGVILFLASVGYLGWLLKDRIHFVIELEEKEILPRMVSFFHKLFEIIKALSLLVLGLVIIVAGGGLLVNASSKIALTLGIPELVLGIVFISVGTSLPELALAIISLWRKESAISLGNLFGASILTLTLSLGLISLFGPLQYELFDLYFNLAVMLFLAGLLILFSQLKISPKIMGLILLLCYVGYLAIQWR